MEILLVICLQNYVYRKSITQGLTEDRWRVGSFESQNHEQICHCRTEHGSGKYYGGPARQIL
jgi:hypothetical protein